MESRNHFASAIKKTVFFVRLSRGVFRKALRVGMYKLILMKKLTTIIGATLFASLILTSCGGSIESDAKAYADLMCKQKNAKDPTEMTKLAEEATKMAAKYTSEADSKSWVEAITKEMAAGCK